MKFKTSLLASKDLENIWLFTFNKWSIEQADRYLALILDEIEYIAQKPKSGVNFSSVKNGYYYTRVKSHLIFYKINQKNEYVEIIRVFHQKMDIVNKFNI